MVKILIKDATIVTCNDKLPLIKSGYVYIENNIIKAVGKGSPPEEYELAELIIPGKDKIVIPGLVSPLTCLSLYHVRYKIRNLDDIYGYIETLSRSDAYYASLLASMESLKMGVTSLAIIDPHLHEAGEAIEKVGLRGYLLYSKSCTRALDYIKNFWHNRNKQFKVYGVAFSEDEYKLLKDKVDIVYSFHNYINGVKAVIDPKDTNIPPTIWKILPSYRVKDWDKQSLIGIGIAPVYSMMRILNLMKALHAIPSTTLLKYATILPSICLGEEKLGVIDKGFKADIVILDYSEPPGWPIPTTLDYIIEILTSNFLKVHTVIINGEVVLDMGEPLYIGADIIKKAKDKLSNLIDE